MYLLLLSFFFSRMQRLTLLPNDLDIRSDGDALENKVLTSTLTTSRPARRNVCYCFFALHDVFLALARADVCICVWPPPAPALNIAHGIGMGGVRSSWSPCRTESIACRSAVAILLIPTACPPGTSPFSGPQCRDSFAQTNQTCANDASRSFDEAP